MKIDRFFFPFVLVLAALSPGITQGQQPATIQFTCVTWDSLPFEEIFYREGDKGLPVVIGRGVRSDPYKMKGVEALQLFIKHVNEEGKKVYKLVGQAAIQPGAKRMLFMIEKSPTGAELPLRIFGMDDSLVKFPIGSFRFLNSTRTPVQIEFNGSKKAVTPGQFSTIKANAPELGGFVPFLVRNLTGNTVAETRLFAQPRGRKIAILLPPAKPGGRLKLRFLPEVIPLSPPEPKPGPTG